MKTIRIETEATVIMVHYSDGSGEPLAICAYGNPEAAKTLVDWMKVAQPSMEITMMRIPVMLDEPIDEIPK